MIIDSLYVWCAFFLVALCFRPQNTPQDWAFAALMSIGLMELSHLAMQEGRWVAGFFVGNVMGFFTKKRLDLPVVFFPKLEGMKNLMSILCGGDM